MQPEKPLQQSSAQTKHPFFYCDLCIISSFFSFFSLLKHADDTFLFKLAGLWRRRWQQSGSFSPLFANANGFFCSVSPLFLFGPTASRHQKWYSSRQGTIGLVEPSVSPALHKWTFHVSVYLRVKSQEPLHEYHCITTHIWVLCCNQGPVGSDWSTAAQLTGRRLEQMLIDRRPAAPTVLPLLMRSINAAAVNASFCVYSQEARAAV